MKNYWYILYGFTLYINITMQGGGGGGGGVLKGIAVFSGYK